MATLYLTEQGSELRKTGDRLIVQKDGQELLEIECFKVDAVMIFGAVELTTPAVAKLLGAGIDLALLTLDGRLKGKLVSPLGKNVVLRVRQHELSREPAFALATANAIVRAKISNSRSLLARQARNHPELGLEQHLRDLKDSEKRAHEAKSFESLRGIEGSAARVYFDGLAHACRRELSFPGRRRRPPTDPINALLSLGYTLLTRELWSLTEAAGFDPYIGFYHAIAYGRPSLALDLLEEFRAPIVDHLVLRTTNLEQLTAGDFESSEGEAGLRLTATALPRFISAYEKRMSESLLDREERTRLTARAALQRQVERLGHSVTTGEAYQPCEVEL